MKPSAAEIAHGTALVQRDGWLSGTAPDFQAAVLALCQWQWFAAGETIAHGGDTSGGMFAIAGGAVSLIPAIGPPDAPMIHIACAPFWLGSNPLINHLPRVVSVTARSRCLVARAPQHGLLALLADNPLWWRFIALQLSEAVRLASQIATDLLIPDSRRRCIAVLLRIAGCRDAGAAPVKAAMTQDELAGMANLSRQTIGPILRALAEDGHITANYRSITLNDPTALRKIADT